jgi:GntR family transcriptional regulator/MocR family aminotransferase
MRLEYARRRAALIEGLAPVAAPGPGDRGEPRPPRLLGDTAGMHMVLALPGGYPAARLAEAAAAAGVVVYPLDRYYAGPPAMSGLVLGYGAATVPQIRQATAILAPLLARLP